MNCKFEAFTEILKTLSSIVYEAKQLDEYAGSRIAEWADYVAAKAAHYGKAPTYTLMTFCGYVYETRDESLKKHLQTLAHAFDRYELWGDRGWASYYAYYAIWSARDLDGAYVLRNRFIGEKDFEPVPFSEIVDGIRLLGTNNHLKRLEVIADRLAEVA